MPSPKQNRENLQEQVQHKRLYEQMERLANGIEKSNSFKFTMAKGIIYGVSTVIGATVIAAIVIGMLSKTVETASDLPLLDKIIEQTQVNSLFEK